MTRLNLKMLFNAAYSRPPITFPQFENEGAFRSWLVKVLIDEALLISKRGNELFVSSELIRPENKKVNSARTLTHRIPGIARLAL